MLGTGLAVTWALATSFLHACTSSNERILFLATFVACTRFQSKHLYHLPVTLLTSNYVLGILHDHATLVRIWRRAKKRTASLMTTGYNKYTTAKRGGLNDILLHTCGTKPTNEDTRTTAARPPRQGRDRHTARQNKIVHLRVMVIGVIAQWRGAKHKMKRKNKQKNQCQKRKNARFHPHVKNEADTHPRAQTKLRLIENSGQKIARQRQKLT